MTQGTESWAGPEIEDEPVRQSSAIERTASDGVQAYETASMALAAAAKAQVEARFVLALRRPRDIMDVRVRLLHECERPGFAEAARYSKPQGRKFDEETGQWVENRVEGPSARFAEAALRIMGNLQVESATLYDDERQRLVRVTCTDLETNATTGADVTVTKTLERSKLRKNQRPLKTRTNSYGKLVYIVEATDDEVENKVASYVSKMRRNLILQLLPADIRDECMTAVIKTMARQDKADPDAARKRLVDAFAKLGISPSELTRYLGHDTNALNPSELADLRAVYSAIADGETRWVDVMESRTAEVDPEDKEARKRHQQTEMLIAKHAKKTSKQTKADPKPQPAQQAPAPSTGGPPPMPPESFDPDDDGRPS